MEVRKPRVIHGIARIFQRGVTLCQSEGTHQIVMSFQPPAVGCLLKTDLQREGEGGVKDTPRTPRAYALDHSL